MTLTGLVRQPSSIPVRVDKQYYFLYMHTDSHFKALFGFPKLLIISEYKKN